MAFLLMLVRGGMDGVRQDDGTSSRKSGIPEIQDEREKVRMGE